MHILSEDDPPPLFPLCIPLIHIHTNIIQKGDTCQYKVKTGAMTGGKGSSPPIDISSVFEYIKLFSRQLFKEMNSKAKTHKTWKKEPKWAWL